MTLAGKAILLWQNLIKARLITSLLFFSVPTVFVLLMTGCNNSEPEKYSFNGSTMGTSYNITVVLGAEQDAAQLPNLVQQRLDQLNNIFSTYKPESELSQLNASEVGVTYSLTPEMLDVLKLSQNLYRTTNGAFNPAIGPLVDLWGFGPLPMGEHIPSDDQISEQLLMVDFSQLILDESKSVAAKMRPLQIDLSAVAKGYAVDQVAELLEINGFLDYLVEVGGELRLSGLSQQGKPWRIGIEQPILERGAAQKVLALSNVGLATSGDYRNYVEREGIRYSHTIDPVTGKPVVNKLASVTVIDLDSATADALATAFMVMGDNTAMAYAKKHGISAYFIVKEDEGFGEHYSPAFDRLMDKMNEDAENEAIKNEATRN